MDSPTTLLFTARDGRTLDVLVGGYASSLTALVCHHGTPSDATIWNDWHADAVENKLRLISVSRPGYAFSERKPGRSVSCAAADVEDVLDALGIEKFLVIGWSGGGPHGESDLDSLSDMGPENIEHKKIAIQGEEPLREWAKVNAAAWFTIADEDLVAALGGLVPEIDVYALNEQGQAKIWASSIRRCLQNGIDGYIDDSLVFCKYWGFKPAEIQTPVTIWQGDLDLMVPFTHGQWLIKHIPNAKGMLEIGHGHISLIADKKQDIIDDLVSHLKNSA